MKDIQIDEGVCHACRAETVWILVAMVSVLMLFIEFGEIIDA